MKLINTKSATLNSALQPVGYCIIINFVYICLIAYTYVVIAPVLQQMYFHFASSFVGLNDSLVQAKF